MSLSLLSESHGGIVKSHARLVDYFTDSVLNIQVRLLSVIESDGFQ